MKTLIISSLIAVSSIFTFVAPSYAETVTVTTTERVIRKPVREEYRPRHQQRASRDCFVKKCARAVTAASSLIKLVFAVRQLRMITMSGRMTGARFAMYHAECELL